MGAKLSAQQKKMEAQAAANNNNSSNNNNKARPANSSAAPTSTPAAQTGAAPRAKAAPSGNVGNDYNIFDSKLSINDFDLLRVLGKGSFGKVMLVKKTDDPTQSLYAMKTLRKAALVKRNQVAHTATERYILENIHCPFLVHLKYAFQTPEKLYMVLDYMAGGELFFWLKKEKKFSENRARLYAAEITLALEALHNANIIYRDLKPENILLDAEGHIRLTDFGLAKGDITGPGSEGGTKTFCGTPEYLAPEMLENKGHGKAVDWWALGTLLFEMLTGLPPFYDTNVQRMYHKILHDPLRFPKADNRQVSDPAKDILRRLLERQITERLGSKQGAIELKRTQFFSVFDFERLNNKGYEPEFKPPTSANQTDVRNFDTEFTSEQPVDSMVTTTMTGTMQDKSNFQGFTFQDK